MSALLNPDVGDSQRRRAARPAQFLASIACACPSCESSCKPHLFVTAVSSSVSSPETFAVELLNPLSLYEFAKGLSNEDEGGGWSGSGQGEGGDGDGWGSVSFSHRLARIAAVNKGEG